LSPDWTMSSWWINTEVAMISRKLDQSRSIIGETEKGMKKKHTNWLIHYRKKLGPSLSWVYDGQTILMRCNLHSTNNCVSSHVRNLSWTWCFNLVHS
jgi:hypothetical protein